MQDIELTQDEQGLFDITVDNSQFNSVDGLQTSIEVSLFTDARAPESLVPEAMNRRGWVGNIITAVEEREIGSLLWLLDQARVTTGTTAKANIYARASLLHFTDDNIASTINVDVNRSQRVVEIAIEIKIKNNTTERYNTLWRNTDASGISNI